MTVEFDDSEFCEFTPGRGIRFSPIEYMGRMYNAASVDVVTSDGRKETHLLVDRRLQGALRQHGGLGGAVDDTVSYFCAPDDRIYAALEDIVGEKVEARKPAGRYRVRITETYVKYVDVAADSEPDAYAAAVDGSNGLDEDYDATIDYDDFERTIVVEGRS